MPWHKECSLLLWMRRWSVFCLISLVFSAPLAMAQSSADLCQEVVPVSVKVGNETLRRLNISKPAHLQCVPKAPYRSWKVLRTEWTPADEQLWQDFVTRIGQSGCTTVDSCLASNANPFRDDSDIQTTHYSDCADFPMFLRAYFSYKRGLPFSMGLYPRANNMTEEQTAMVNQRRAKAEATGKLEEFEVAFKDNRYSVNGNSLGGRMTVPSVRATNFSNVLDQIHNQISSGTYRMLQSAGMQQPDFYSPRIMRSSIKPGTVLYKPTGHLAVVYEVTNEGVVKFIDAHPDNGVTRGVYNEEYARSNPNHGGGFKNWRPLRLIGAQYTEGKGFLGGRIELVPDREISDLSYEQYYGTASNPNFDWKHARYIFNNREMKLHEFVKARLFRGNYELDPLQTFKNDLDILCEDFQGRATAVETAVQVGLNLRAHPAQLPENIYGADGDWESYSTPGRDLRIRTRVLNLIESAKDYMARWVHKDPALKYNGQNLKQDLLKAYLAKDMSCKISYTNSKKEKIAMGLSTAISRITLQSFDPYLCPERRWGARYQSELATCKESMDKAEWYEYSQFLRNSTERDPSEVMGWSLGELKDLVGRRAVNNNHNSESYDVLQKLREL